MGANATKVMASPGVGAGAGAGTGAGAGPFLGPVRTPKTEARAFFTPPPRTRLGAEVPHSTPAEVARALVLSTPAIRREVLTPGTTSGRPVLCTVNGILTYDNAPEGLYPDVAIVRSLTASMSRVSVSSAGSDLTTPQVTTQELVRGRVYKGPSEDSGAPIVLDVSLPGPSWAQGAPLVLSMSMGRVLDALTEICRAGYTLGVPRDVVGSTVVCGHWSGTLALCLVSRSRGTRVGIQYELTLTTRPGGGGGGEEEVMLPDLHTFPSPRFLSFQMSEESTTDLEEAIGFHLQTFLGFIRGVDFSEVSVLKGFGLQEFVDGKDVRNNALASAAFGISTYNRKAVPFLGRAVGNWELKGTLEAAPSPAPRVFTTAQQRVKERSREIFARSILNATSSLKYSLLPALPSDTHVMWNTLPTLGSEKVLCDLMAREGQNFVHRLVDISTMQTDADNLVKVVGVIGEPAAGMVVAKYVLWPGEAKGLRADDEAALACTITDTLTHLSPGFLPVYGAFDIQGNGTAPRRVCMVMEVGGFSLGILNTALWGPLRTAPSLRADVAISILAQMAAAAAVIRAAGINLLSDHPGNVLACPCDPATVLRFQLFGLEVIVPTFGVLVKYIDWGQTYIQSTNPDAEGREVFTPVTPIDTAVEFRNKTKWKEQGVGREVAPEFPPLFRTTLDALCVHHLQDIECCQTQKRHYPNYLPDFLATCATYFKERAPRAVPTQTFTLPAETTTCLLGLDMRPQGRDLP